MSDYMFMLESHLNGEQNRILSLIRTAAENAALNIFLTGGAMRDMMGGFAIRDLDFTVEGAALKFAKSVAQSSGAEIVNTDDTRKSAELVFPGGITVSIAMARQERYPKPASKPQVVPATIHEDLRCRDFTVNAIALSLSKASRGLLLDPTNGLGDLSHKELRTTGNYTLYDDPSRVLRLFRLKVRLGFELDSRTYSQFENVRNAGLLAKIPSDALAREMRAIGSDPLAGDILKLLDEQKILEVVAPALSGAKLNVAGFQKLQKARAIPPFGAAGFEIEHFPLFLNVLFEKSTPRDKSALISGLGIDKAEADAAQKLDARGKKAEKEIAGIKAHKPSAHYAVLSKIPGEVLLYVLMHSSQRVVLDRIKNYFQKYLPLAMEVTDNDVIEAGGQSGTPKFLKLQQQLVAAKLDARPKKVEEPPPPPPPPIVSGRRSSSFARS